MTSAEASRRRRLRTGALATAAALLFGGTALSQPAQPAAASASQAPRHDNFYWVGEQNKASLIMLAEEGVISPDLAARIARSVTQVIADGGAPGAARSGDYLQVEKAMMAIGGPDVSRIHSGRSRQDMQQTTYRVTAREALLNTFERFIESREALLKLAQSHRDAVLPFNTHAVQAQPTTLGHYIGGYLEAFSRGSDRYQQAWVRLNLSPLGGAAGGTSSFPVNRVRLAELLGFDGVVVNSFDSGHIAHEDLGVELASLSASNALTISMFSADLLTQYPNPRPWFELAAGSQTGGSSIMPQKRNPVGIENLQQASGTVTGQAVTYFFQSQNVPSGLGSYKSSLPIESTRSAGEMYGRMTAMLGGLIFHPDRALERVNEDYSMTTELADILQREAEVPFRVGHHFASELVTFGRTNKLGPAQIRYRDAQRIYAEAAKEMEWPSERLPLSEAQFRRALTAENMVASAKPIGGPQAAEVARMLEVERVRLEADRAWLTATRAKLEAAARSRDTGLENLVRAGG